MFPAIAISVFGLLGAAASIIAAIRLVPAYRRERPPAPSSRKATQKRDRYGEELQLLRYMVEQLWAERENPRTAELERRRYRYGGQYDPFDPPAVYPVGRRFEDR